MHIGMTGTRDGMTKSQGGAFIMLMSRLNPTYLHHGDCIGADADAHELAKAMSVPSIVHPPSDSSLRAFKESIEVREEKGYFARNRDIVNESEVLLGFPKLLVETKGGTWYTINYGRRTKGTEVYIIYPDGEVVRQWGRKFMP